MGERQWPPALYDEYDAATIKRYGFEDGSSRCSECGAKGTPVTPLFPHGSGYSCRSCSDFSDHAHHFLRGMIGNAAIKISGSLVRRKRREFISNAMMLGAIAIQEMSNMGDPDDGLGSENSDERRRSVRQELAIVAKHCFRGSFEAMLAVGDEDPAPCRIDWKITCGPNGELPDHPTVKCFVDGKDCPDALRGSMKIGVFQSVAWELINTGFIKGRGKAMVKGCRDVRMVSFARIPKAAAPAKKAA